MGTARSGRVVRVGCRSSAGHDRAHATSPAHCSAVPLRTPSRVVSEPRRRCAEWLRTHRKRARLRAGAVRTVAMIRRSRGNARGAGVSAARAGAGAAGRQDAWADVRRRARRLSGRGAVRAEHDAGEQMLRALGLGRSRAEGARGAPHGPPRCWSGGGRWRGGGDTADVDCGPSAEAQTGVGATVARERFVKPLPMPSLRLGQTRAAFTCGGGARPARPRPSVPSKRPDRAQRCSPVGRWPRSARSAGSRRCTRPRRAEA
jgi:hypothetical protein